MPPPCHRDRSASAPAGADAATGARAGAGSAGASLASSSMLSSGSSAAGNESLPRREGTGRGADRGRPALGSSAAPAARTVRAATTPARSSLAPASACAAAGWSRNSGAASRRANHRHTAGSRLSVGKKTLCPALGPAAADSGFPPHLSVAPGAARQRPFIGNLIAHQRQRVYARHRESQCHGLGHAIPGHRPGPSWRPGRADRGPAAAQHRGYSLEDFAGNRRPENRRLRIIAGAVQASGARRRPGVTTRNPPPPPPAPGT